MLPGLIWRLIAASTLPSALRTPCALPHFARTDIGLRIDTSCSSCCRLAEYEGEMNVTETLVVELIAICRVVARKLDTSRGEADR
jgi:hypothetical protein